MRAAYALLASVLCVGLATAAWADNDKDKGRGKGHGHGPRGQAVVVQPQRVIVVPERDRRIVYGYYRTEYANVRCPPGLARKGNGCLPPGQVYARPRPVYVVGQPLPPTVIYQPVPPVLIERLEPVPPGYGYVQVDNDVLLMDMTSRMIADIVNDLSLD